MPRTTHRSTSGTKLYARRGKDGQFEDIQTYKRAHSQDVKRSSAAERTAQEKKVATKTSARTKNASAKKSARPGTKKK